MKIGDLLLLKGYINKKQLTSALSKQAEEAINYDRSVPLGKILIEEGHAIEYFGGTKNTTKWWLENKKEEKTPAVNWDC